MKKTTLILAILATAAVAWGLTVFEQLNLEAMCSEVTLTAGVVTDMTPAVSRLSDGPKAYNICNEEQTVTDIRCGYETSLSTISGSGYLGFKVPAGESRYRAVGGSIVLYCTPELSAGTLVVVREAYR